jgi:hypothetical protein
MANATTAGATIRNTFRMLSSHSNQPKRQNMRTWPDSGQSRAILLRKIGRAIPGGDLAAESIENLSMTLLC